MSIDMSGTVLDTAKRVFLEEVAGLNDRIDRCMKERTANCPFFTDQLVLRQASPSHRRQDVEELSARTLVACHHMVMNVFDHLEGVSAQIHRVRLPIQVHWSDTRGAIEGAVRIRYVLDPDVDAETRFLRGVALSIHSADEEAAALTDMIAVMPGVLPGHKAAIKKRQELAKKIKRAGLIVRTNSDTGRTSSVAWGNAGKPISTKEKVDEQIRRHFADHPALYRFTSGSAHSIPWVLDDSATMASAGRRIEWSPDRVSIAAAVTTSLRASELLLRTYAWYGGLDENSIVAETVQRRVAVERLMGMHVSTTIRTKRRS